MLTANAAARARQRPIDHTRKLAIHHDLAGLEFDEESTAELAQVRGFSVHAPAHEQCMSLSHPTVNSVREFTPRLLT